MAISENSKEYKKLGSRHANYMTKKIYNVQD